MTTTETAQSAVARAAIEGLTSTPRRLPAALFYDAAGSALFEEITALPEYYQTRTERGILERIAPELREALGGPLDLVELGAGSSAKTEVLLGGLDVRTYVPIDVSPTALEDAAVRLRERFPDLDVAPVVGNYHEPVDLPPPADGHARAAFFPGSTIGNLQPAEAAALLRRVARMLGSGGRGGPNLQGAILTVGETGTVYTSLTSYCYMPCDWFVFMHLGKTTLVVLFLYLLSKSF